MTSSSVGIHSGKTGHKDLKNGRKIHDFSVSEVTRKIPANMIRILKRRAASIVCGGLGTMSFRYSFEDRN